MTTTEPTYRILSVTRAGATIATPAQPRTHLSWDTLEAAAQQHDPELRAAYRAMLASARAELPAALLREAWGRIGESGSVGLRHLLGAAERDGRVLSTLREIGSLRNRGLLPEATQAMAMLDTLALGWDGGEPAYVLADVDEAVRLLSDAAAQS